MKVEISANENPKHDVQQMEQMELFSLCATHLWHELIFTSGDLKTFKAETPVAMFDAMLPSSGFKMTLHKIKLFYTR